MTNEEIRKEREWLQAQSDLIEALEESVGFKTNSEIYEEYEEENKAVNDILWAITQLYKEKTPDMMNHLAKAIRKFK